MATLTILNNATLVSTGNTLIGKQGATTDALTTGYSVPSITGLNKQLTGQLATATVATIYNATNDAPATGAYLHFWADQIVYLQFIGTATNTIVKLLAQVPQVWPCSALCAANATAITGGATPATEVLQKVVLGNYSGVTVNYTFLIAA